MTLIRCIDVETTGMEPPAEIIEIGWQDVVIENATPKLGASGGALFSAERGIPPETMAVHHIRPGDLVGKPLCDADTLALHAHVNGPAALVAHNAEFECKWFTPEILNGRPVICTYKAALRVWPDAPSHGNQALMYWLGLHGQMDEALRFPPHRAGPDAYVTAHILMTLLAKGVTGKEMVAWTREPRLLPTCPIGKFRGKPWPEVEEGFLTWMLKQEAMESDLKWNAQRELDRRAEVQAATDRVSAIKGEG